MRIPDRPIWIDGRLCRGEEAGLSLFDRGAREILAGLSFRDSEAAGQRFRRFAWARRLVDVDRYRIEWNPEDPQNLTATGRGRREDEPGR